MSAQEKYYITTAIDYANSKPHIGHAYEKTAADALARWKRVTGFDVQFSIGTDEHSANVETRARELNISPAEYCDQIATLFHAAWQGLNISYDRFIRTSEPVHHAAAQEMVRRALQNGDIYKGRYEGLYCKSCENYYIETELKDGACPVHGTKPVWLSEENYFFRLSHYAEPLLQHIAAHPEFIQPETRRNEVLNVIKGGLKDISVSRSSSAWGIPFPDDPAHVIYVWFDALINYISAIGFPGEMEKFSRYWPADVHVIGKDITRFHCIIWPAMLMSAKLPLPKQVFGHGFIYLKGEKISKTRGNVVDPLDMIKEYGTDPFRYVLLASNNFSGDGDFSEEGTIERYNSDLANDLGNLLNRTLTMVEKYCEGRIPVVTKAAAEHDHVLADMVNPLFPVFNQAMEQLDFSRAIALVMDLVKRANKYIEESAPWTCFKKGETERVNAIMYNLLEVLRVVAIYIYPFMPSTTPRIFQQLGDATSSQVPNLPAQAAWGILQSGQAIAKAAPLFPRIEKEPKAKA